MADIKMRESTVSDAERDLIIGTNSFDREACDPHGPGTRLPTKSIQFNFTEKQTTKFRLWDRRHVSERHAHELYDNPHEGRLTWHFNWPVLGSAVQIVKVSCVCGEVADFTDWDMYSEDMSKGSAHRVVSV